MTWLVSRVWGGDAKEVSQEFGVNLPGIPDSWYDYAADYGLKAGDHAGLDIAMTKGTEIRAAQGGVVIQTGESPYFRPYPVWVREDDGDVAIYGHLSKSVVKLGDKVKAGDLLGLSGEQTVPGNPAQTDDSGEHLHFELRVPNAGAQPDGLGFLGYHVVDPTDELTGATGSDRGNSGGFLSGLPSIVGPEKLVMVAGGIVLAIGAAGLVASIG